MKFFGSIANSLRKLFVCSLSLKSELMMQFCCVAPHNSLCKRVCEPKYGHQDTNSTIGSNRTVVWSWKFLFFRASSLDFKVYNSIMSIKSNADGIHLKFVKITLPFILTYIAHIFNRIVTTEYFPQKLKIANIISVVKKA